MRCHLFRSHALDFVRLQQDGLRRTITLKQARRTAKALFEEIKAAGYPGEYTRVKDFIREWRAGEGQSATTTAFVPLSFELGGKSPLLVFDDADLDLAVNLAVEQFDNAGQVCLGAFRILVQDGIADEFLERVRAKAATLVQGDPRDEATDVSALVSRAGTRNRSGAACPSARGRGWLGRRGRPNRRRRNRAW